MDLFCIYIMPNFTLTNSCPIYCRESKTDDYTEEIHANYTPKIYRSFVSELT